MDVPGQAPGDLAGPSEQELLIQAAVAAPSLHNTQPWQFAVTPDAVEVYADPSRQLRHADPAGRAMLVSVGAAVFNLRVAAEHLRFRPEVRVIPDLVWREAPVLVATVALGSRLDDTGPLAVLYPAVAVRRTNRRPFRPDPVPEAALDVLVAAARAEGAGLSVYVDPADVAWTIGLIHEADRVEREDVAVPGERAAWIGGPDRDEGIPVGSLGPLPAGYGTPFRDLGSGVATPREYAVFERTPTVAVLSTAGDRPSDWVLAGQALEHLLLDASRAGLSASFMNQPLEQPELRSRVQVTRAGTPHPQMLLRIGYGEPVPPTPRRDLSAVRREPGDAAQSTDG